MSQTPLFSLTDVTYQVDQTALLAGISASVLPGEVIGILGQNGAGKSTLLKILGGLISPTAGSIQFKGRPLRSLSAAQRSRQIAWLGAADSALPYRVNEVIAMGRFPYRSRLGTLTPSDHAIINACAQTCDVDGLTTHYFDTLSSGEQQRVLLARAMAQQPVVYLLDEPVSHLDFAHQKSVTQHIANLASRDGKTVIMVSHHISLLAPICHRVLLLKNGRSLAFGSRKSVLTPHQLTALFDTPVAVHDVGDVTVFT